VYRHSGSKEQFSKGLKGTLKENAYWASREERRGHLDEERKNFRG
jgi:hypothetical protein